MAGIGFELKKLYRADTGVFRTVGAMGYSVFTTIGPTLLVVAALVVTNLLLQRWGVSEAEKMTFAGCTLYCFVGALVISSAFDAALSRYVADCLFSREEAKIRPAFQGAAAMFALLYGLAGGAFALLLRFKSGLDAHYCLMVYLLLVGVGLTFTLSVFVTAIKAYRRITLAYLIGVLLIIGVGLLCYHLLRLPIGHSMITGFAAGFLSIVLQLFLFLHMAFPTGEGSRLAFLGAIRSRKLLLLSGTFYILGLYVHNAVFWFGSELQVAAAGLIYCAPAYDMASFLAMLTSVSAMVIFVVRVETSFYPHYKAYCEAALGQSLSGIRLAREKMVRTLVNEVYFVGELQFIITVVLISLAVTFLPLIGIAGLTLDLYPILALGYYAVFMMHLLMIFLYYFDDQAGAALVGLLFFALSLLGTLLTRRLGINYYGLGLVISALLCWVAAFLRLRAVLSSVDQRMFCRGRQRGRGDAVS